MAVLEEGNTLYGAGLSHWKGQTGVNHAIEARDRLINSELIGRLAGPNQPHAFFAILHTFHEFFKMKKGHSLRLRILK